jgi:single-stranded-DNA-specific exonuclease
LGFAPIVGQTLLNRGVETPEQGLTFCNPSVDELHDPFLMKEMDAAVERLKGAIERGEGILIFGDYDVDGMSATALLVRELDALGCQVYYYIPNRLVEGYGLNKERIAKADEEGIKLIVTVDNGVSCHEEIAFASTLGIDVIVCDHHEPEGELPPAHAVVNPKRSDSTFDLSVSRSLGRWRSPEAGDRAVGKVAGESGFRRARHGGRHRAARRREQDPGRLRAGDDE